MTISSYFLALLVVIIWAYNTILIKMGVGEIPPLLLTVLRFMLVAVLVVPFTRIRRHDIPLLILLAFTFGFMHFALLFVGLSYADAGISAILVQLGTPLTILIAWVVLKEQLKFKHVLGIVISFIGVFILSGSPDMPKPLAILFLIGSALGWATTNIIIKKQNSCMTPLTLTGWSSFFAIPIVGGLSFYFERNAIEALHSATWVGWTAVIYSAIASSIFAYTLWYWLLRKYPINSIIPFSLLSPVFAVFFGIIFLNEPISANKLIGAMLVIGGIFCAIINFKALLIKRCRNLPN